MSASPSKEKLSSIIRFWANSYSPDRKLAQSSVKRRKVDGANEVQIEEQSETKIKLNFNNLQYESGEPDAANCDEELNNPDETPYECQYYNCNSEFEVLQDSIEELISSQHRSNSYEELEAEPPLNELSQKLNMDNEDIIADIDGLGTQKRMSIEELKVVEEDDEELFNKQDQCVSLLELM